MAQYATLKAAIQDVIKTNGNEEITGALLQQSLLAMINSLGSDYQFAGIATPATNPGTPDQNVFYIAAEPGTYPNFNNATIKSVGIFTWNGAWTIKQTGIPFGSSVAASTFVPTQLDMTPDGTGYYSAGDVITPLDSYRHKALDVTEYAGKLLIIRSGYLRPGGIVYVGQYNYVKKSDTTFSLLSDYIVSVDGIIPQNAVAVRLPDDAVELQCSWNYNQIGLTAFVLDGVLFEVQKPERLLSVSMTTSNNIDYVGNPGQTFGGLYQFKILFVWINSHPIGDVTFNIGGTGAKPVYIVTPKGEERLSEKTMDAMPAFYYLLYDNVSDRYVVQSIYNKCFDYPVTRFDMTPDGAGYYSAGGTITSFPRYRRKVFDVTAYAGKRLRVRVGYQNNFTSYSFVKLSDNSFVTLQSCEIASPFTNDCCKDVLLPSNAVELQCSWDMGIFKYPGIAFIYYDEFYNYYSDFYSQFGPISVEYFSDNIFKTFNTTPDGSGYYSAGGTITPLGSYRNKAYDLTAYKGKTLRCKFGFPNKPAGWSWIKYDNNTYVKLETVGYQSGDEWIFVVPNNIAELEVSWDVRAGIVPYMIYDADFPGQIEELRNLISKPLVGKTIFLFGDSISSDDYTWYRDKLSAITGATVLNQGASGRNAAYQASNEYFQRLANNPNDIVVVLVGGNDSGASGTIGTFDANSPLGQMGESVVQETDISVDYNGTKFIQAISHIIRKWRSIYWNFRLNAGLTAHILDTENENTVVYPSSGTATELQCINYAAAQGWTLGYGQRYVMMTTETVESKQAKLSAVRQPKMFICTTLPQRRYNAGSYWSNPENWERKRLACIECAQKYGMPLIDLAKEFAIDWDVEPYWPGQGYTGTSKTDNQGIYTMDGLHPNEFGYEYISQIVAKHLVK